MPEWIQHIDDNVLMWFQSEHTKFRDYNLLNLTALGSTTVLAPLIIFICGLLVMHRHFKKAILLVLAVVALYAATEGLKAWVDRPRPVLEKKAPSRTHSASFPSSHSSLSMGVYLMLAFCLRRPRAQGGHSAVFLYAVVWAVLVAFMVGISRLYFANHFLSDVLAGWLLGLVFALLFLASDRLTERRSGAELEPAPK